MVIVTITPNFKSKKTDELRYDMYSISKNYLEILFFFKTWSPNKITLPLQWLFRVVRFFWDILIIIILLNYHWSNK